MLKIIPLISLVSFLTVVSQSFLKKGLIKIGGIKIESLSGFANSLLKLFQEKFILIGVFIALVAAFAWLIIISRRDLTFVFPISGGLFYVFLFLISWLFLKEGITIWRIVGTATIMAGISIMIFLK